LVDVAGLSPQAASDLAASSLAEWDTRGERSLDRQAWRRAIPTFAALIAAVLIGAAGIGALVYVRFIR
jgi:hypothetical protein